MARTIVLAPDVTAATSDPIEVAAGSVVTVGIYADTAGALSDVRCIVRQETPGIANSIDRLTQNKRSTVLSGPGIFHVQRPPLGGLPVGVFTEA